MQFLLPFTRRFVNPITRLVAGWLPGFGILRYRGRRSGTEYRTPMNVFRRGDEYVFALTYGPDVQWVKNIVAAGECQLVTRGRPIRLVEPRLVHDPRRSLMPPVVRQFLGLMRVTEFLRMRIAAAPGSGQPAGPVEVQRDVRGRMDGDR
jgi:deazaflavin-dependent oxidoreductase (nitroreductase family)